MVDAVAPVAGVAAAGRAAEDLLKPPKAGAEPPVLLNELPNLNFGIAGPVGSALSFSVAAMAFCALVKDSFT